MSDKRSKWEIFDRSAFDAVSDEPPIDGYDEIEAQLHAATKRAEALTKEIKALHKREAVSVRELNQLAKLHGQRGQTIAHLEGKLRTSNADRDSLRAQVEMLAGALRETYHTLIGYAPWENSIMPIEVNGQIGDAIDQALSSLHHAGERWSKMVAVCEAAKRHTDLSTDGPTTWKRLKQALADWQKVVG